MTPVRPSDHDQEEAFGRWLLEQHAMIARESGARASSVEIPPHVDEATRAELAQAERCLRALDALKRQRDNLELDWGTDETASDGTPRRIGRFEIERELGRGGAGVVFLAFDPDLRRNVALKVPRPEALVHRDLRERFIREARAVASLGHSNVVTVFEVGEAGPICYIASAYVDGETLSSYLDRQTDPIPPSRAARWVLAVAEAVEHAHERGILHRDIKPGNVLLERRAGDSTTPGDLVEESLVPRLSDFGLAKLLDGERDITRTGSILGTPAYMAPEQAQGKLDEIDERTDVYALGAVLYELLTGHPPLEGDGDADTLRRVVTDDPQRPRRLRKDVPRDLEEVTLKCLEKDPSRRYESAAALAADLGRFLDNQPVRAKPPTVLDRLAKWSRRHSDVAWFAVAVLLVGMIGVGAAAVAISRLYREAEAQRQRADGHREVLRRELYALNMQQAFRAWNEKRTDEVQDILGRQIPAADESDTRTFPWYVLRSWSSQAPLAVLHGHLGAVREVAVHPDGRRLVSAGDDGTIRTWDIAHGKLLQTIKASQRTLNALAISPDGKTVATGYNTLRLWDLEQEKVVDELGDFETTIEEAVFTPDGRYVIAGSRNQPARIISLADRSVRLLNTNTGNESFAITDGGETVTAPSHVNDKHYIRSYNIATETVRRRFNDTSYTKYHLALETPLPGYFLVATTNAKIQLLHAGSHRIAASTLTQPTEINDMAVSGNQVVLVAACTDGMLRAWWLNEGWTSRSAKEFRFGHCDAIPAHAGAVTSIAFLDDNRLVSAGAGGTLKIWKLEHQMAPPREMSAATTRFCLAPDAQHLVRHEKGRLYFERCDTGETLWSLDYPRGDLTAVRFAPDGSRFTTADDGGRVDLWDVGAQRLLASFEHEYQVMGLAISPCHRWLAITGVDGYTMVWDIATQRTVFEYKLASWGRDVAFSPDGSLLALGGHAPEILLFDTDSWTIAKRLENLPEMHTFQFGPRGRYLASTHRDNGIRLWDLHSGELVTTLEGHGTGALTTVAFHPSGNTLVSSGHDSTIRYWDLVTHRHLGAEHLRSAWVARQIVFSPEGDRMLSARQFDVKPRWALGRLHTDMPSGQTADR